MSKGFIRFEDTDDGDGISVQVQLLPMPKADGALTPAQAACLGFGNKIMETLGRSQEMMIEEERVEDLSIQMMGDNGKPLNEDVTPIADLTDIEPDPSPN